jgi:hypothetical protein
VSESKQYKWRTEVVQFDPAEACKAVIEALAMGGIKAWDGDGVGMVVQMLENAYRQRDALQRDHAASAAQRDARVAEQTTETERLRDCGRDEWNRAAGLKQHLAELERRAAAADALAFFADNFYAMVQGESPSLLEDDGNAFELRQALAAYRALAQPDAARAEGERESCPELEEAGRLIASFPTSIRKESP